MKTNIAKALFDAKVVKFGLFTYVSGKRGPVYVDVRTLPSYPESMKTVTDGMSKEIEKLKPDVIAGAETAGIPLAAVVSSKTMIPMVYVRKKPKSYGTKSKVEGVLNKGDRVVLIDDMITDGGSKMDFIDGVRSVGGVVDDLFVVLDREQGGSEALSSVGVELHSLITLKDMLEYMKKNKSIREEDYRSVLDYLNDPVAWDMKLAEKDNRLKE